MAIDRQHRSAGVPKRCSKPHWLTIRTPQPDTRPLHRTLPRRVRTRAERIRVIVARGSSLFLPVAAQTQTQTPPHLPWTDWVVECYDAALIQLC